MNPSNLFNEFMQKFESLWGQDLASVDNEMRAQIRRVAHSAFDKMDLVTREEFDAQCAVLARSRETLDRLEQAVRELQQQLTTQSPNTE